MKKSRIILIATLVVVASALAYIFDVFIEDSNFRVMQPNTVYRAAQITGAEWQEIYAKHPFASILNLRGENLDKDWYPPELAFATSNTIAHEDLALSANKQPTLETTEQLVEMMRTAPKPLLIHCKQGADRTGLASALYAYAILGQPADQAAKQLSLRFGHFPWLTSRTGAMDKAFATYIAAHPQQPPS